MGPPRTKYFLSITPGFSSVFQTTTTVQSVLCEFECMDLKLKLVNLFVFKLRDFYFVRLWKPNARPEKLKFLQVGKKRGGQEPNRKDI